MRKQESHSSPRRKCKYQQQMARTDIRRVASLQQKQMEISRGRDHRARGQRFDRVRSGGCVGMPVLRCSGLGAGLHLQGILTAFAHPREAKTQRPTRQTPASAT